jgi:hypothetical protein
LFDQSPNIRNLEVTESGLASKIVAVLSAIFCSRSISAALSAGEKSPRAITFVRFAIEFVLSESHLLIRRPPVAGPAPEDREVVALQAAAEVPAYCFCRRLAPVGVLWATVNDITATAPTARNDADIGTALTAF